MLSDGSHISYVPIVGLAQYTMEQKKTLLITEPLSYKEYDPSVDLKFEVGSVRPMICVPIIHIQEQRIEGCIQLEFKMKHYLSSNPLMGGSYGQFKLDVVTKEILEIFSN
jgi:hypothetical protein